MLNKGMMLLFCALLLMVGAVGCSDDEKTTTPTPTDPVTSPLELLDLQALVEAVAPPEFTAPVSIPTGVDSLGVWTTGDYPLLEKVFGSSDPQSLYRNINDFKQNLRILSSAVLVDENGDIVAGEFTDSILIDLNGDSTMAHYTGVVTALTDPTAIPAQSQAIIGENVDIDYLVTITVDEMPGSTEQFGLTANDSVQTILQFHMMTEEGVRTESNLVYATMNLNDSTFTFRGLGYVGYVSTEIFAYGYNMTSESTSDFSYRMSWFSNELPDDETMLGCIVGGGNKDVEFAMKYRQFKPADTTVMDSYSTYDQVFGPNYTEGTGLISDYEAYLADELIYTYEAIPTGQVTSPWTE
jgi:hypothetical protein